MIPPAPPPNSIPFNFYCIIAIVFSMLSTFLPLDFGGMKRAELHAETTDELDAPRSVHEEDDAAAPAKHNIVPRMKNMVVPMLAMVGVILAVLIVTGDGNPTAGNGMQALLWGCMLSVLVIAVMCRAEKLYKLDRLVGEILKGMATMLPIACILLLGLTMGTLVKHLDTGNYLSSIFMRALVPELLPLLTFIISIMLSFATGTSMGTMAIMSVIALPMAINMGMDVPLVAGALFGGSIFGDHVSPISDTTIMSCATTG